MMYTCMTHEMSDKEINDEMIIVEVFEINDV